MDLLRDWRRRVFGAAAGAVIAPTAILLAAVIVGVGGGGLGGLRSITEAFRGPTLPPVAPSAADDRRTADEAGRLLARVRPPTPRLAADPAFTPVPVAAAGAPTATGGPRRRGRERPGPPTRTETPTAVPPTATPAPTATVAPTPAPARTPTPLRRVGDALKTVTDRVPVGGQTAGQVVDLLVDTVEALPPVLGVRP